jgi:hypothetical protein
MGVIKIYIIEHLYNSGFSILKVIKSLPVSKELSI